MHRPFSMTTGTLGLQLNLQSRPEVLLVPRSHPGVVWLQHDLHLSLTVAGICPVNRDSIDYILSKNGSGNAIIIVVGGAAESLNCTPGKNSVTLRNRKGFVKLALRHG